MSIFNSIVAFFHDGGMFMLPTAIVMALGIAVAIERWWYLRGAEARNRKEWDRLAPTIEQGEYATAREDAADSKAEIGQIIERGLSRLGGNGTREDVEGAMEEGLMEATPGMEKRTHYLTTFANIAMLLGLLGTIMGLIHGFAAVAAVDPAARSQELSAAVSEAMNNTAFGLMVAIPLLFIHALLSSKTTRLVEGLEIASVKLLNSLPGLHRGE